jgi:hypothetical protein
VNFRPFRLGLGALILAATATATGLAQYTSPEVPLPAATPSPNPDASGRPVRGHHGGKSSTAATPEPTDSPVPPQFSTLDGIWEVELQPPLRKNAVYEHFSLVQTGSALTGYWEHDPHKTHTPVTGTFDGRLISISATRDDGTTVSFTGYVESFGDMVGLMRAGPRDPGTSFTAEHRKKEK